MKRIKLAIFVASVITTNYAHAADRLPGTDKGLAAGKPAGGHHRSPRATGAAATPAGATGTALRMPALAAPSVPSSKPISPVLATGTPAGSTTWATGAPQAPTDLRSVMTAEQAAKQPPVKHTAAKPKPSNAHVATGVAAPDSTSATATSHTPVLPTSPVPLSLSGTLAGSESDRSGSGSPKAPSPKALAMTSTAATGAAVVAADAGPSDAAGTNSSTPLRSTSPSTLRKPCSPQHLGSAADALGMAAPGITGTGYGLPLPTLAVASVTTTGGSDVTAKGSPTTASHSTRSRSHSPRHFGGAADASGMAAPGSTGTTAASDTCAAGAGSGPSGTATEDDDFTVVAAVAGLPTRGRTPHRETSAVARDRSATPNLCEETSTRHLGFGAKLRPHATTLSILSGFMTGSSAVDSAELHKGVHIAVDIARRERDSSHKSVNIVPVVPTSFDVASIPAVIEQLAARGKKFTPHLDTLGDLNLLCKEGEAAAAKNLAMVIPVIRDFQAAVAGQHTTVAAYRAHNRRCKSPEISKPDAGIGIDDPIESLTTAFRTALKLAAAQAAEKRS